MTPPLSAPLLDEPPANDDSSGVRAARAADGSAQPLHPDRDRRVRLPVKPAPTQGDARQVRSLEAQRDRMLISRAQQGDLEAFERLVHRHRRRAYAIAVALVRDERDAQELVQEAFIRVYKNLPSFRQGSSFFTWLYRIVSNLAVDLLRKPYRRDRVLGDAHGSPQADERALVSRPQGADPMEVIRRKEIAEHLNRALAALPPYHRDVVVMRELEGLSYQEMADRSGVSKGTIMSRLFHARQKLQKALLDCYTEQVGRLPELKREAI